MLQQKIPAGHGFAVLVELGIAMAVFGANLWRSAALTLSGNDLRGPIDASTSPR